MMLLAIKTGSFSAPLGNTATCQGYRGTGMLSGAYENRVCEAFLSYH